MNRTFLMAVASAVLFGFGVSGRATAHEGHDHGPSNGHSQPGEHSPPALPRIESFPFDQPQSPLRQRPFYGRATPFDAEDQEPLSVGGDRHSLPCCRGGRCNTPAADSAPYGFEENVPTNAVRPGREEWTRAGRELQALVYQLEFTAEIVSEELRFEFARERDADQLLGMVVEVNQRTQHLRTSLQEGDEPNHLRGDLQNVAAAVDALSQSLSRFRGNTSAGRGVVRLQRIVGEIASRLNDRQPVIDSLSPIGPSPLDGVRSLSPPLAIPPQAKGISLLSPEDQQAALDQKTCPVTGELLGSHGKPLKVEIDGRSVFVCCQGCVAELKAAPDRFRIGR